jgi:hypothetical protein
VNVIQEKEKLKTRNRTFFVVVDGWEMKVKRG